VAALGVVARARLGRGDSPGALTASREANDALVSLGEIEEGESMVGLVHAEALAASGAADDARAVLVTTHERLLARAERIGEPAWRHRFLHDVPVNARIATLVEDGPGAINRPGESPTRETNRRTRTITSPGAGV